MTSETHPIDVDWLPVPRSGDGRVGLTFAPGKKQRGALSGGWDRDLDTDLRRLHDDLGVTRMVTLLEDAEFAELAIDDLVDVASSHGIRVCRLPIRDGSTPPDETPVAGVVAAIREWVAGGECVVIHCKGGLGRAGTIGGCVLVASGCTPEEAFDALVAARGPNCPETTEQRDFIRRFASNFEARPSGPVRPLASSP